MHSSHLSLSSLLLLLLPSSPSSFLTPFSLVISPSSSPSSSTLLLFRHSSFFSTFPLLHSSSPPPLFSPSPLPLLPLHPFPLTHLPSQPLPPSSSSFPPLLPPHSSSPFSPPHPPPLFPPHPFCFSTPHPFNPLSSSSLPFSSLIFLFASSFPSPSHVLLNLLLPRFLLSSSFAFSFIITLFLSLSPLFLSSPPLPSPSPPFLSLLLSYSSSLSPLSLFGILFPSLFSSSISSFLFSSFLFSPSLFSPSLSYSSPSSLSPLADDSELQAIQWRVVIIDEAHRLKNRNCKLLEELKSLDMEHRILLTGTPLQNSVEELFSLLNFLEPSTFPSHLTFLQQFGDLKTEEQVKELKAVCEMEMVVEGRL